MKKIIAGITLAVMLVAGASTIFPPVDSSTATAVHPFASDPYDPFM